MPHPAPPSGSHAGVLPPAAGLGHSDSVYLAAIRAWAAAERQSQAPDRPAGVTGPHPYDDLRAAKKALFALADAK
jgi:hypothetical protein